MTFTTRKGFLYLLALLAPSAWASDHAALHDQSVLLLANALICFDADPAANPDVQHRQSLLGAQSALRELLDGESWSGELHRDVEQLIELSETLVEMPQEQQPSYSTMLVQMLDAHQRIDAQSSYLDGTDDATPSARARMERLGINIGDLLLHAQARSARVLGEHSLRLGQEGFTHLDQQIESDFKALGDEFPSLRKQHMAYRFVRKSLLSPIPGKANGSSERYVSAVIVELASLRRTVSD
ncbi:hypothetical protein NG726_08805 [Pseudomonas sp. MOB-449]|nr:hypothetical protein [Pseudomonas sp. MOB-449]